MAHSPLLHWVGSTHPGSPAEEGKWLRGTGDNKEQSLFNFRAYNTVVLD